jgi:hypothetical protein
MTNTRALLVSSLVLVGGCGTTIFNARFNTEPLGTPPAAAQAVGTVGLDVGAGTVQVVASPDSSTTDHFARIHHPTAPSPQTGMKCVFTASGPGKYTMLAPMYIPEGAGLATVQFETSDPSATSYTSFLHIDFMQTNTIRVDDNPAVTFGTFPRNKAFTLAVNLTITAGSATAHFSMLGDGTSGTLDYNIPASALPIAQMFGSVRFWMGFQWTGAFYVTDISVTKQ